MYDVPKEKFRVIINEHEWGSEEIDVKAQTLSP